jgi:hypothetical protein
VRAGSCGALDQPFDQAAAAAEAALEASHAAVIALVIIAEQMEQPVERKDAKLSRKGMAGFPRLTPGHAGGNHDVAEVSPLVSGKRQDVGWFVFLSVLVVQGAHACIRDQRDRHVTARPRRRDR